jgi:superoxide reductase
LYGAEERRPMGDAMELFCGVNRVVDADHPTDLEKKHAPVLCVPERIEEGKPFPVTVRVGRVPHAMEYGHHIQWIHLYAGENLVGSAVLSPAMTAPEVTFQVVFRGKGHRTVGLRALSRCSSHGDWEGREEVTFG